MESLNERWREEAEAKGRPFKPVRLGIGLNTGICCVGNLGSETRFDYSVIGDNVNVASRLEGQSKTYDVGTVVGESTTARAPDFAFLELDLLKVKGKTEATRIFALLGDSALKQSQDFIALAERHGEFLARYRAKDWDAAEALSRECEKMNSSRLDQLYALYRERIAYLPDEPAPAPMGRHGRGLVEVAPMPQLVLLALAAVAVLMLKHAVADFYLQTPVSIFEQGDLRPSRRLHPCRHPRGADAARLSRAGAGLAAARRRHRARRVRRPLSHRLAEGAGHPPQRLDARRTAASGSRSAPISSCTG